MHEMLSTWTASRWCTLDWQTVTWILEISWNEQSRLAAVRRETPAVLGHTHTHIYIGYWKVSLGYIGYVSVLVRGNWGGAGQPKVAVFATSASPRRLAAVRRHAEQLGCHQWDVLKINLNINLNGWLFKNVQESISMYRWCIGDGIFKTEWDSGAFGTFQQEHFTWRVALVVWHCYMLEKVFWFWRNSNSSQRRRFLLCAFGTCLLACFGRELERCPAARKAYGRRKQ
jgi:hypothetical protein